MCSSFQFIEQQAFEMSEKIRKDSIYKFVRIEVSGCSNKGTNKENEFTNDCDPISETPLGYISKVILEDEKGKLYSVEPTLDGLRFATGEITYKEYEKRQKKESRNLISIFFIAVGFISLAMLTVKWYLI